MNLMWVRRNNTMTWKVVQIRIEYFSAIESRADRLKTRMLAASTLFSRLNIFAVSTWIDVIGDNKWDLKHIYTWDRSGSGENTYLQSTVSTSLHRMRLSASIYCNYNWKLTFEFFAIFPPNTNNRQHEMNLLFVMAAWIDKEKWLSHNEWGEEKKVEMKYIVYQRHEIFQ